MRHARKVLEAGMREYFRIKNHVSESRKFLTAKRREAQDKHTVPAAGCTTAKRSVAKTAWIAPGNAKK
jgi:hypothetical protein